MKKSGIWIMLLFVLALGVGCSGGAGTITQAPPTAVPTDELPTATVEESAEETANNPPDEPTDPPTATEEPMPFPGRPDAPAGVDDDFRSDPASVVAATGRPQLLEFFTFW